MYVEGYKRVKEETEFEEVEMDTDTNNLRVTAGRLLNKSAGGLVQGLRREWSCRGEVYRSLETSPGHMNTDNHRAPLGLASGQAPPEQTHRFSSDCQAPPTPLLFVASEWGAAPSHLPCAQEALVWSVFNVCVPTRSSGVSCYQSALHRQCWYLHSQWHAQSSFLCLCFKWSQMLLCEIESPEQDTTWSQCFTPFGELSALHESREPYLNKVLQGLERKVWEWSSWPANKTPEHRPLF